MPAHLIIPFLILLAAPAEQPVSDTAFLLPSAITSFVDPDEYIVGIGDRLWLSVPGGIPFSSSAESADRTLIELPVSVDGTVTLPGQPPIQAAGRTLAQCSSALLSALNTRYGRLNASVGLAASAAFQIPVTGAVQRPGMVDVNGLSRLSYAISAAGGKGANAAMSRVILVDVHGDTVWHDLNLFLQHGIISENPLVSRGSRVHVPRAASFVYVHGSRGGPRIVLEHVPGEYPLEAVSRAGGFNENARVDTIGILRNNNLTWVRPSGSQLFPLEPEDVLIIPQVYPTVSVTGYVFNPGPVPYNPGMDSGYYIGMAGGYLREANRGGTRVLSPTSDRPTRPDRAAYITPGSVIEVPRKSLLFWEDYLLILTGVAGVIIAYSSIN